MNWEMTGKRVYGNGERTVFYEWDPMRIEARRRAIAHANRSGYWFKTFYALIWPDGREQTFSTLREAKEAGERAILEEL